MVHELSQMSNGACVALKTLPDRGDRTKNLFMKSFNFVSANAACDASMRKLNCHVEPRAEAPKVESVVCGAANGHLDSKSSTTSSHASGDNLHAQDDEDVDLAKLCSAFRRLEECTGDRSVGVNSKAAENQMDTTCTPCHTEASNTFRAPYIEESSLQSAVHHIAHYSPLEESSLQSVVWHTAQTPPLGGRTRRTSMVEESSLQSAVCHTAQTPPLGGSTRRTSMVEESSLQSAVYRTAQTPPVGGGHVRRGDRLWGLGRPCSGSTSWSCGSNAVPTPRSMTSVPFDDDISEFASGHAPNLNISLPFCTDQGFVRSPIYHSPHASPPAKGERTRREYPLWGLSRPCSSSSTLSCGSHVRSRSSTGVPFDDDVLELFAGSSAGSARSLMPPSSGVLSCSPGENQIDATPSMSRPDNDAQRLDAWMQRVIAKGGERGLLHTTSCGSLDGGRKSQSIPPAQVTRPKISAVLEESRPDNNAQQLDAWMQRVIAKGNDRPVDEVSISSPDVRSMVLDVRSNLPSLPLDEIIGLTTTPLKTKTKAQPDSASLWRDLDAVHERLKSQSQTLEEQHNKYSEMHNRLAESRRKMQDMPEKESEAKHICPCEHKCPGTNVGFQLEVQLGSDILGTVKFFDHEGLGAICKEFVTDHHLRPIFLTPLEAHAEVMLRMCKEWDTVDVIDLI